MKFKINGIEFFYVEHIKITRKINNHSNCIISLVVDDEIGKLNSYKSLVSSSISLFLSEEGNAIFSGYIEKVRLKKEKHNLLLELECYSNSKKDDIKNYTFIYQEPEKKIGDIVKKLELEGNKPIFLDGSLENKKLENVVIQKDETNFSFLKRLLNQNELPFIVESVLASSKIWIGERKGNSYKIENIPFEIEFLGKKEMAKITLLNSFYELGDVLNILSKNYYIVENEIEYRKGSCFCTYILISNYKDIEFENYSTTEKRFVGEVIENKDKELKGRMQVKFKEDKMVADGKPCWIKSIVPYSTKDTGFYLMPSKGDKVLVTFDDSLEPFILGSIRENKHENFENPNDLFIKNEFGKEFNLKEKEINIVSVFDNIFLSLDEEKIEINNGKTGIYIEKERIIFQNNKGVVVIDDNITLQKENGAKVIINEDIAIDGKKIDIKASDATINASNNFETKANFVSVSGDKIENNANSIDINGSKTTINKKVTVS